MCGIIAYLGSEREVFPFFIDCLRRLEYRGYDSSGIAYINSSNELILFKKEGEVSILEDHFRNSNASFSIGVAHTRWATHGEANDVNAHPHTSCNNDLVIVHNGIVENYDSLKLFLEKNGHQFRSKTDSEVLAHLIEEFYSPEEKNLEDAVMKSLAEIEGTYGLVVLSKYERRLVGARNGSPLILGINDPQEYFLSSDRTAFLEHTKKVVYLDDKEIISITPSGYRIIDSKKEQVDKEVQDIKESIEQIEKGGYTHFMLKEINEQPKTVENCTRGRLNEESLTSKISITISDTKLQSIAKDGRLILLGCGTSWHAGLVGEYIFEKYLRIPVEVEYASEFRYRNPILHPSDLVIAISQSGETADTLFALRESKKFTNVMGIVNIVGSSISKEAEDSAGGIYIHAGPEIGVASTKAFTGQLVALNLLNLYFGRKIKTISDQEAREIIENLQSLPLKIEATLKTDKQIQDLAEKYKNKNNFLYLGRGTNFPVALEGALKLKEISYIHAEGYPAAEMKHGPIALIDNDMPTVFITGDGINYEKVLSNIQEVKTRKGHTIAIANEDDQRIARMVKNRIIDDVVYVPKTIEPLAPIINTIPLQLFAYYLAVINGKNPDKPRHLAKSVTVE